MQQYMEDRIRNIEILLEKQQEQLNKQSNDINKIYLLLKSKEKKENKNKSIDKDCDSNNRIISFLNPSTPTTITTATTASNNNSNSNNNNSNNISMFTTTTTTSSVPITTATTVTPTTITTNEQKKLLRSDGSIRQKRKRAIHSAKELCKTLPYFMKLKPNEIDPIPYENSNGKRPRSRSQLNSTPVYDNIQLEFTSSSTSQLNSSNRTTENTQYSHIENCLSSYQNNEGNSSVALYNLLNNLKNFDNQYKVIVQMNEIINDPNHPNSKEYKSFIEFQGGVIVFVGWLHDISELLHSLSILPELINTKISEYTSSHSQPYNSFLNSLIITGSKTGHGIEITFEKNNIDYRVYIQYLLNILDKISWSKNLILTTRIDKILKSFYKSYTNLGKILLSQSLAIYCNLGTEYLEFAQTLKDPWAKYRQLIS